MTPNALDLAALTRRIDAKLARFAAGPGMAVGVVMDGALALHRHAGLASVEHGVAIGPETRFRIASVSKQFTCAAILMLEAEGRLGLDDPVVAHLPDLPDHHVSLRHLMHNSSGVRDMLELMRHGGADLGTPLAAEALMAAIGRQRGLNFPPGSSYLYSNSNFLLLGHVVERVAGESLGAFLERRVFAPLGMTRTALVADTGQVVPGLATGYMPRDGGFVRAPHAFPLHGEGGLVSCVEDLAVWANHLDRGGAALAERLHEQHKLADGSESFYARGQTVRRRRGLVMVGHGGLWPGYKTEFLRAPALGLTVIAIANHGGADPNGLGLAVMDMLLDAHPEVAPAPPPPDLVAGAALAGRWLSPNRNASLDVAIEGDALVLRAYGAPLACHALADGWLGADHGGTVLAVRPAGEALEVERAPGRRVTWHRSRGGVLPEGLAGRYACAETDSRWTLAEGAEGWTVQAAGPVVAGAAPWALEPIEGELMRVWLPGLGYRAWIDVRALVEGDRVVALEANGARARGLRYLREE